VDGLSILTEYYFLGCKTSFLPEGKYYFYPLNEKPPGYEKKLNTDIYYNALTAGYTAGEEANDN